jgi:hypothetical protein
MTVNAEDKRRIETLKKVTLSCKAGSHPDSSDLLSETDSFDIIFGIGSEGLTPFEFELGKKTEGDSFAFDVFSKNLCKTFQHLTIPGLNVPESAEKIHFTFNVEKVAAADSREVVKAMAELNACQGGSCDCCGH